MNAHTAALSDAADTGPDTVVTIVDTLDDMAAERTSIPFGDVVETIGAQGFGPLLLGLAALLPSSRPLTAPTAPPPKRL